MDYKDLTSILDSISSEDFKKLNNVLKDTCKLNDFLVNTSNVERNILLRKLELFSEIHSRVDGFDSSIQRFVPDYQRLDFVHCDFTGIGFEWDGPHFALIWEVNPLLDSVMVIPATSQPRKENIPGIIPVGIIPGLNGKKSTLLVTDMTRVSRKRLKKLTYHHPRKGNISVRLQQPWLDRINQAIVTTYTNEITFEEFLINKCGVDMPQDISILKNWRFKPVKGYYDFKQQILHIRLWNEENTTQIKLISPKVQYHKGLKKQLIKDLLDEDSSIKNSANEKYKQLYL